jgi:hypothetical protein
MRLLLAACLLLLILSSGSFAEPVLGLQTTNSAFTQSAAPITGAKVEQIKLDDSSHTATVTIRNLSNQTITAFDLAVHKIRTSGKSDISDTSFRLEDLLLGINSGQIEGIRPGETYDEIIQNVSNNVTVDVDFVAFSDASTEFTNPEMVKQVISARKAIVDADNRTKEIIRNASSKEEAIDNLTRLWEESKETAPLMTPTLETHLYNLKHQHSQSAADEQQRMLEYADKNEKDAQSVSFHTNLHRRTQ